MRNITIPPKGKSTGRKPKYNLADMKKGDKRYFTGEHVRQCVSQYASRTQKEFACRKQPDNSIMVVRVK